MRFLRMPALCEMTGEAPSTNYKNVSEGLLPPPVKLGPQRSAWPDYEIERIMRARVAGATDDDIRALVKRIVAERANAAVAA